MSDTDKISISRAEYDRLRELEIEYGGFCGGVNAMQANHRREPETASQRRERLRMQALDQAVQCRGLNDILSGDGILALAKLFGDFLDGAAP